MLERIKNKIGFCVRLIGYQIAMSMFALMISIPVFNSGTVRTITASFSIVLYLIIIYFSAHDRGSKDYVGRNNPINPPKLYDGFIYGLVAQTTNIVINIIYIFTTKVYVALYLGQFMYSPLNFIHGEITQLSREFLIIWYFIVAIPEIVVCGVAYILGYKGIKIGDILKFNKAEIHSAPREDDPSTPEVK